MCNDSLYTKKKEQGLYYFAQCMLNCWKCIIKAFCLWYETPDGGLKVLVYILIKNWRLVSILHIHTDLLLMMSIPNDQKLNGQKVIWNKLLPTKLSLEKIPQHLSCFCLYFVYFTGKKQSFWAECCLCCSMHRNLLRAAIVSNFYQLFLWLSFFFFLTTTACLFFLQMTHTKI